LPSRQSSNASNQADREASFGPFRLLPSQQLLLDGGKPAPIGGRALDILIALVESAGEVVTKDELISCAWPNVSVDEGNLRTQIAIIRKALRDGEAGVRYIATIAGRGYCFVSPVSRSKEQATLPVDERISWPVSHMPTRLTKVIGRAESISEIAGRLSRSRFTTIVGPGGIGKTTVALAVAEQRTALYIDGICFVDLASLVDPTIVPAKLASMLGMRITSKDIMAELTAHLRNKHVLLILDSCERFVEAAAILVEALLRGTLGLHILATSREPLRAEGEAIYRLSPLTIPSPTDRLSAEEALEFPAVELFVERAASSVGIFALTDDNTLMVVDICRQLDGIALAIELAAGRVGTLGVKGVAGFLKDRFKLLTRGKRTALPRHQTLEATLDWSYETLAERERATLRRLSIFPGNFSLEGASSVVADQDISSGDVLDIVDELASKSLVSVDMRGIEGAYRLLDTTRAYAIKKLNESGKSEQIARRHADYCLKFLGNGNMGKETSPTPEYLATMTPLVEDVRAALNWAFSPTGDTNVALALTTATIPLWTHLSSNAECRKYVEQALSCIEPESAPDLRRDMMLFTALGATLIYTDGPSPKANMAWETALKYARELHDIDYQLRALWGLFQIRFNTGEFRPALAFAEQLRRLAASSTDPADALLGDRLVGLSHFYLGDHIRGRQHIDSMLSGYNNLRKQTHIVRFQFDQTIVAKTILARILWALGQPDTAMARVRELVTEAQSTNHAMSLALGLAQAACPISLWRGDFSDAESFIRLLVEHTDRHTLELWKTWGNCFEGMLLIAREDYQPGLRMLRSAMNKLPQHHMRYGGTYAYLAEALAVTGDISGGLSVIEEAIGRCEQDDERWHMAEFLRVKGEIFRFQSGPSATEAAEDNFCQSLDWARRQGVLSWELRATMSLARLRQARGDVIETREALVSVYSRFKEGLQTADLKAAKALIEALC
jgi:predicted ATPase/DNA-binding winged helix-turn-helix (wHTH) protein